MVKYNKSKQKSINANLAKKEKQIKQKGNEKTTVQVAAVDKKTGRRLIISLPFFYKEVPVRRRRDPDVGVEEDIEYEEDDEEDDDEEEENEADDENERRIWKQLLPKNDARKLFRSHGNSARNLRHLKQKQAELYQIGKGQNNSITNYFQRSNEVIADNNEEENLPPAEEAKEELEEEVAGTDVEDNLEEQENNEKKKYRKFSNKAALEEKLENLKAKLGYSENSKNDAIKDKKYSKEVGMDIGKMRI
jgi:hypothetical protein